MASVGPDGGRWGMSQGEGLNHKQMNEKRERAKNANPLKRGVALFRGCCYCTEA